MKNFIKVIDIEGEMALVRIDKIVCVLETDAGSSLYMDNPRERTVINSSEKPVNIATKIREAGH